MNKFHHTNTATFLNYWLTKVRPEEVVPQLREWSEPEYDEQGEPREGCNMLYCAGGHVPFVPEFKTLGVRGHVSNAWPIMVIENEIVEGYEVAEHLFGSKDLFRPRLELEDGSPTDYEMVIERLKNHLAMLEHS